MDKKFERTVDQKDSDPTSSLGDRKKNTNKVDIDEKNHQRPTEQALNAWANHQKLKKPIPNVSLF